jgi:hypothetical protein
LLEGAVQVTWAPLLLASAVTAVGGPGGATSDGVTAFEAAESGPGPTALIAVTLKV